MVPNIFVLKKWIFWEIFEAGHSWTFIWTFLRCVKMVFFRGLFGPNFLSINVGTLSSKTILTQRAEVCQKYFEDFFSYNLVGEKLFKKSLKKHDFDTARKFDFCLYINVGGIKYHKNINNFIKMNLLKDFRSYQAEADEAINAELLLSNKCIVKMFCGTGKSLLMRKCKSVQNQKLVVYVFPSLSLIDQFCTDYFTKVGFASPFKISSENDSTTDPSLICAALQSDTNKIICVTYQSYNTLLDNLGSTKIDVCIYDEAHHAVGETYQKLIFESEASVRKQIFFTATPKNANGITMYDRDNLDVGICGKLVYDYSYLRGLVDGYVNPFEIRVDMYTENANRSLYESIARAILVSGNNRVLTFHADVNTESNTSVLNFVNESEFVCAFMKVLAEEFSEKAGLYKSFKMIALDASMKMEKRRTILDKFDTTTGNEVYIISSCETIGEGIDTKNANMCVFVDPKSSFVKIIQNIGRIVRPQSKPSTVLIPCWVDKDKYIGCDEDREKCDEVIRSDLNKGGNFNGILNVLSALRQEDEDLYDICLHYPDTYSPQEVKSNLEKHGYKVLDPVGDGELLETMEYLLDQDIDYDDYEDCDTNEEMIMRIAEDNNVCVEVHTNSFENQIEKYNSECESGTTIRLYKEEEDEEEGCQVYCPIVKKCGKRKNGGSIKELSRKDRIKIDVHTNPNVKVLWKLVGDFTKEMCSCVLECEVVKYDLSLIHI
jgi:superfamily II DNA or RNA helicase